MTPMTGHTNQDQEGREAVMTTVSAERLAKVFVEVADTLVDEFDLIDFLHMLTDRTADLFGASAVGLLLADQRGRLEFLAASTRTPTPGTVPGPNRERPCLDAFRTATPVINADLAEAGDRWPRFAPRATAAGFRSVHAFPLRLRSEAIGALNVFGSQPGSTLGDADVPIVQAPADIAAIGLIQERHPPRRDPHRATPGRALNNSRIVIEQAKGAVAQAHGVSVDEAFTLIRDYGCGWVREDCNGPPHTWRRDSAASTTRLAGASWGRCTCRRSTATCWHKTRSSTPLAPSSRASRVNMPMWGASGSGDQSSPRMGRSDDAWLSAELWAD
jgi:GAF domain/ANTAR domain